MPMGIQQTAHQAADNFANHLQGAVMMLDEGRKITVEGMLLIRNDGSGPAQRFKVIAVFEQNEASGLEQRVGDTVNPALEALNRCPTFFTLFQVLSREGEPLVTDEITGWFHKQAMVRPNTWKEWREERVGEY